MAPSAVWPRQEKDDDEVDPFNEVDPDRKISRFPRAIYTLRLDESNRTAKDFAPGIYWLGARYNGPVGRSINWKPIRTAERQGAGKRL